MARARQLLVAIGALIALIAVGCSDPVVPQARSTTQELVEATPIPVPPTATPPPTPTPTPTPVGLPVATPAPVVQPGLSSDVIRLAVVFDDETAGVADRLFLDGWIGAAAWANEVNRSGGLGGRDVEVVPIDSRLFDHRSAIEQVCLGDFFAIIGSHSLGDSDGTEILGSEQCLIADFAGQVYGARRAVAPTTFVSNPFLNEQRQAGPARYLAEQFPGAAENLGLLYFTALDLETATERQREMLEAQGYEVVFNLVVDLTEDLAERVVPRWAESGAESLVWTADPQRLISFLQALDEPPEFVLCEWGCYSQQFLVDGGEAVEGVYAWVAHTPFFSQNSRGELVLYTANLARFDREAGWSEIGMQSWMAGRMFEAAYTSLLQDEPEAPTREQLVEVARDLTFWTANGVLSGTNPVEGSPDPCFVLMVVRDGRWQQEHPQPPRDKDCDEENLFELVTTRSLGAAVATVVDPVPEGGVEAEDTAGEPDE